MAIYYVRTDGNDGNTGTGSASTLAWKTIQKALGASGIGSGDTLYIAPGVYRESVTIGGTYSTTTYITGDPTSTQFSGVAAGEVRITGLPSETSSTSIGTPITATSKNNLYWSNIFFQNQVRVIIATTCTGWTFDKCYAQSMRAGGGSVTGSVATVTMTTNAGTPLGLTCVKCIFDSSFCFHVNVPKDSVTYNSGMTWTDCLFNIPNNVTYPAAIYTESGGGSVFPTGGAITNCVFIGSSTAIGAIVCEYGWNSTTPFAIKNCLYLGAGRFLNCATAGAMVETYNRYPNATLTGVTASGTSSSLGTYGSDLGYSTLVGLPSVYAYGSTLGSVNAGFGVSSGAPATDMFGVTWTGATPDVGAVTYRNLSTLTGYQPTERNASTITIAPGSTSQSIELYLGVTGLTASTAGLSARYNRTRTASVDIPLVARTIGQAWISGGFAEVDAVNMPGVYRVDIPDAALAAGADDVTLLVRGASGTNGAVMTVKLSSGGLTSGQTASAVWGAAVAGYNTALDFGGVVNETRNVVGSTEGLVQALPQTIWDEPYTTHTGANTFGARVLKTTVDNRLVDVGSSQHIHANVHAIVDSTVAAAELSGALLHNGTDYISADLLSPATPATTLRMGPYSVVADQTKQEINVDILTGASLPVVLQLVDANGTGIPLTGATLSVKIYTTSGTLVATYTGTASYADAGFVTFTLTSAVTATPGTYYVTVTRSSGATDTSIYGGLRLYVRSN